MARTPSKQPNPGRPPVHGMPLIPDPLPRQPHFGAARATEPVASRAQPAQQSLLPVRASATLRLSDSGVYVWAVAPRAGRVD